MMTKRDFTLQKSYFCEKYIKHLKYYLPGNNTNPMLHIRAPSSISYGESSSISCSVTASFPDDSLQLIWGDNATFWSFEDGK